MGFLERSKSQRAKDPKVHGDRGFESETEREGSTTVNRAVSRRKSIFHFAAATPMRSDEKPTSPGSRKSFDDSRVAEELDSTDEMLAPHNRIDFRAGNDTFSFPTPSPRLPEKDVSFLSSPSPLATAQSSPRIGIAIGSPSNAPMYNRSYTTGQLPSRTERQPAPVTAQTWEQTSTQLQRPEAKKSKSAWKSFGKLFKSKHAKQDVLEPFDGIATQQHGSAPVLPSKDPARPSPSPVPGSIPSYHSHTGSITRGIKRFEARAEADRANYMASVDRSMTSSQNPLKAHPIPGSTQDARPSPPRKQPYVKKELPIEPDMLKVEDEWPSAIPRTPKLDIDIPDVQLDRYSVMFEKLLQPRSSILERRQSRLTLLDTNSSGKNDSATALVLPGKEKEPLPAVPQRSVTSPHLNRMPSLSIKVDRREKGKKKHAVQETKPVAFHRPRTLARSNTAPPDAVSPVKAAFARKVISPVKERMARPSVDSPPSSPAYSEASLPPTPNTVHTVGESVSISVPAFDPSTMPTPRTSKYHMQAPPIPHVANSEDEAVPDSRYLRVKSPEDLERQIVQVSVARQVSVSKARRQVRNTVDVKQPLRPRVVELGKNRKSTVGMIECDD